MTQRTWVDGYVAALQHEHPRYGIAGPEEQARLDAGFLSEARSRYIQQFGVQEPHVYWFQKLRAPRGRVSA